MNDYAMKARYNRSGSVEVEILGRRNRAAIRRKSSEPLGSEWRDPGRQGAGARSQDSRVPLGRGSGCIPKGNRGVNENLAFLQPGRDKP